jgi:predicted metalloprotease with PDZ domain
MINYCISYSNPLTHLVEIEISFGNITTPFLDVQLPAWRPGRYELQNYAANIKQFKAAGDADLVLSYAKISRNCWRVETSVSKEIKISYQYYACQMDAGGCWLDEEQLYLNFICCMMFVQDRINEACSVNLTLPSDYQIACGLPKENNLLKAQDFYHLVDSPMIASASLTHFSFESKNVPFNIWIQGNNYVDREKIISDFKKYTDEQIAMMGDFPEKEYHYLFQFLPYRHYHGVEHRNSTVITLGPSETIPGKGYSDLVGISSHELYHAWNIIKIRPTKMMPYDFTKENYFPTGFVAEGFTTYYGDLFLVRSAVISKEKYFAELNTTLKRHFDNFGNENLSLAESSLDLWVDGYAAGIPNRKVSIYVKGCVAALILDLEIRRDTKNKKSLDDLMRLLWKDFGKTGKGYSMLDIIAKVNQIAGVDKKDFFEECIFGKTDLKERLDTALKTVGCTLLEKPSESIAEREFGFRIVNRGEKIFVEAITPGSPAEKGMSRDDEILKIEGQTPLGELNEILSSLDEVKFTIKRSGRMVEVLLIKDNEGNYFSEYAIIRSEKADPVEKENFEKWVRVIRFA